MRVLVQRCKNASVKVDNQITGMCPNGLLLFVGFTEGDGEEEIAYMTRKVLHLRIFPDEAGVMNKSVLDIKGSILLVSQFTLYADAQKGNRPSYLKALNGEKAVLLYNRFKEELEKEILVQAGIFGADMEVSLTNMGPTTIWLEK